MKAVILLGTLKTTGISNTQTLAEFIGESLTSQNIDFEIIRLADYHILPGTYTHLETPDDWPDIFDKMVNADIIIFATPIWWNSHSSELQRCIERLDEVYDQILNGEESPFDGKVGGIIITGDSDGVETITGHIANFFCTLGITVPAYSALGIIWDGHAKDAKLTRKQLIKYYKEHYGEDADIMAQSLKKWANTQ
jgi:multimeric flavodoxin WrbA